MWEDFDAAECELRVSELIARTTGDDRDVARDAYRFLGCWYDSRGQTEAALSAYVESIREIKWREQDPQEDPTVLERRAIKGKPGQRLLAASNPSTPLSGLQSLKEHASDEMRAALATNPRCPTDWLREFSNDPEWMTRSLVAGHPLTPLDCLAQLAEDPDQAVRTSLACNWSITSDMALRLSADEWKGCRWGVARNIATSRDVLLTLAQDDEIAVAEQARETLANS